jgi:hypothetical protein
MSEEITRDEPVSPSESEKVSAPAKETQETATPAEKSKMLKVHGKEFDVSTDLGLLQAQAWAEAISSVVGRQGQELGDLRRTAKQFVSETPREDESLVAKKAKEKVAQGDVEGALDEVLSHARAIEARASKKLDVERANNALWDEYFQDRPALTSRIGKEKVKKIAEASVNLYDVSKDVFKSLDDFFLPIVGSFKEKPILDVAPKAKAEKPPVSLTGRSAASSSVDDKAPVTSLALGINTVLDSRHLRRK